MIRVCFTKWPSPDGAGLSENHLTMSVIGLTIIHSRLIRQIPVNTGCETVLLCGHKTAFEGPCRSAGVCEQPQPGATSRPRHGKLEYCFPRSPLPRSGRRCGQSGKKRAFEK